MISFLFIILLFFYINAIIINYKIVYIIRKDKGYFMKRKKQLPPALAILLSFAIVIIIGTILLMLPFSTQIESNLTFIEALFTTVSCVCVTGLSVISDIGVTLSVFGKIIMCILMEIGGLGFITIALFVFIVLGKNVSIKNKFLLKEALNQDSSKGMTNLVKLIVLTSFSIQLVGGIFNYLILKYSINLETYNYTNIELIGISAFHAVSAFNNAGFDLFGSSSLTNQIFASNVLFNLNTALLIILGGIGFIVIFDLITIKKYKRLTLHTKIVLVTNTILLIAGTILLWVLSNMNLLQAFFQSVSARTAGFATYPMEDMRGSPSFIIFIIFMFFGASPCSTGGGIKTTTIYVIFASMVGYASGKPATAFKRRISTSSIIKAFTLVVIALVFIFTISLTIIIIESNIGILKNHTTHGMDEIIFEVFSAFCTVGNSTGITSSLNWSSKLLLCLSMFAGRLGPLTIMNLWNKNWLVDNSGEVRYVEKSIIIG